MKRLSATLSLLLWASLGFAEDTLREVSWEKLQGDGQLSGGTVVPPGGGATFARLQVQNTREAPTAVTILTLDAPGVTGFPYALTGMVRYHGVTGAGYLEMWNSFPNGQRYFTRSLATSGPLKRLEGG